MLKTDKNQQSFQSPQKLVEKWAVMTALSCYHKTRFVSWRINASLVIVPVCCANKVHCGSCHDPSPAPCHLPHSPPNNILIVTSLYEPHSPPQWQTYRLCHPSIPLMPGYRPTNTASHLPPPSRPKHQHAGVAPLPTQQFPRRPSLPTTTACHHRPTNATSKSTPTQARRN